MKITALIVAAGAGKRLAGERPKGFVDLGGRPMVAWSLDTFQRHRGIDAIVLLVPGDLLDEARRIAAGFPKVAAVLPGGERRQDTVGLGLAEVSRRGADSPDDLVLVHDAARPFASAALLDRVIASASRAGASIPGCRPVDTVRRVEGSRASAVVERDGLVLVQTPQGFRAALLSRAYAAAKEDVTDDAALVQRIGGPVEVVEGEPGNFKVTTPDDLDRARRVASRPGSGA